MRQLKNITVILLLLGAVLYTTAPLFYQGKIFLAKLEARNRLRKTALQTIHISNRNIKWIDEGKELIVDGRLFDVEVFDSKNGVLNLVGLFDDEETSFQKKLNELCVRHESKHRTIFLKYFQSAPYTYFSPDNYQIKPPAFSLQKFAGYITLQRNDIFISIPSPPPQM